MSGSIRASFYLMTVVIPLILCNPCPGQDSSEANLTNVLRVKIDTKPFQTAITLKEFLGLLYEKVSDKGISFPVMIDVAAFRKAHPDGDDVYDTPIQFEKFPPLMTVGSALRIAVDRIKSGDGTFLIRGGMIEITTKQATSREVMLNQPVTAVFKRTTFHHAIQELADETAVSIVIDGKIKELGEKTVTATFQNGVALQDAVRMLAETVDLKVVYLSSGLFLTSPEHAKKMHKELDELYERPKRERSPLAPPLAPPLPMVRVESASVSAVQVKPMPPAR